MTEKKEKSLAGPIIKLVFDLFILGFLVYLALSTEGAESAVWTVGILAFLAVLGIERVEKKLHHPTVHYAIYIETDKSENIPEMVRAAMEKSPYRKA